MARRDLDPIYDEQELIRHSRTVGEAAASHGIDRARAAVRRRLGLPPARLAFVAGSQPPFCGGAGGVFAKLAALARCKRRDPDVFTAFLFIATEPPRANTDFCRVPLAAGGGGRSVGVNPKQMPMEVVSTAVVLTDLLFAGALERMRTVWQAGAIPEPLRRYVEQGGVRPIGVLNMEVVRWLARELDLEPDLWLIDCELEQASIGEGALHRLLHGWADTVAAINRLAPETMLPDPALAPCWVIMADTAMRRKVLIGTGDPQAGELFADHDVLLEGVARKRWSLVFRAIPRVLALSYAFDAQITGQGSGYNKGIEGLGDTAPLPVLPRLAVPTHSIMRPQALGASVAEVLFKGRLDALGWAAAQAMAAA